MKKGFSNFLDNIEEKMTTIPDEPVVEVKKHKPTKRVIKNTVHETVEISEDSLKTRMICELNRFGLNTEAIEEIMSNVFHSGKKVVVRSKKNTTSNFNENVKKLKPETKVDDIPGVNDPIGRASSILDGGSPMLAETLQTQHHGDTRHVETSQPTGEVFNGFNMDSTAEHASALL